MQYNNYNYLLISLIFLHFSYEFTVMEYAFKSLSSSKLKILEDTNVKNLKLIKEILNQDEIISVAIFGDYFSNGLFSILFAIFFYNFCGLIGIVISSFISMLIIMVFGEFIPKKVGEYHWEKIVPKKAKVLYNFSKFFKPFTILVEFISKLILKITRKSEILNKPIITEEDLIDAVSMSIEEGILNQDESRIIENVMDFRDTYAKDIMTPRTDIIAVNLDTPYDEIIQIIKEEAFSRMPVYEDDLDDIVGILHVKDFVKIPKGDTLRRHKNILRPAVFTFEFKYIGQLFNEMRLKKLSIAIVSDEYGGTEGMITTEDLIERIVGAISDEYDEDEDEDIIKIGPGEYLLEGSMNLEELNHILNLELHSDEIDSIAGYIIEKIDRFPEEKEDIVIENLHFHIEKSSKNRIDKIILKL